MRTRLFSTEGEERKDVNTDDEDATSSALSNTEVPSAPHNVEPEQQHTEQQQQQQREEDSHSSSIHDFAYNEKESIKCETAEVELEVSEREILEKERSSTTSSTCRDTAIISTSCHPEDPFLAKLILSIPGMFDVAPLPDSGPNSNNKSIQEQEAGYDHETPGAHAVGGRPFNLEEASPYHFVGGATPAAPMRMTNDLEGSDDDDDENDGMVALEAAVVIDPSVATTATLSDGTFSYSSHDLAQVTRISNTTRNKHPNELEVIDAQPLQDNCHRKDQAERRQQRFFYGLLMCLVMGLVIVLSAVLIAEDSSSSSSSSNAPFEPVYDGRIVTSDPEEVRHPPFQDDGLPTYSSIYSPNWKTPQARNS